MQESGVVIMSHLSVALRRYYSREGNRVIFLNGQSLGRMAMSMLEKQDFRHMDTSTLSRVLKGERLFTPTQLATFCDVLHIPAKENQYLKDCLQQDHDARLNILTNTTRINTSLTREVIRELGVSSKQAFYQGHYDTLHERHELAMQLAHTHILHNPGDKAVQESIGRTLYLEGRVASINASATRAITQIRPILHQLLVMSRQCHSGLLNGYAYALRAEAHYIAGGYSDSTNKHTLYKAAIKHAKIALDHLPTDDHEHMLTLRLMAAAAAYIHDEETVIYVLRQSKELIPRQPKENYINSLHLGFTLSKSLAAIHAPNPFEARELASNHFQRSLENTGIYETSSIKEEIDTLVLMNAGDSAYTKQRIRSGLKIATDNNLVRHKRYFSKLQDII